MKKSYSLLPLYWYNTAKLIKKQFLSVSEGFLRSCLWIYFFCCGYVVLIWPAARVRFFCTFQQAFWAKVESEAEQWGHISWLTKYLTKFRIFARFLRSAQPASMARMSNFRSTASSIRNRCDFTSELRWAQQKNINISTYSFFFIFFMSFFTFLVLLFWTFLVRFSGPPTPSCQKE